MEKLCTKKKNEKSVVECKKMYIKENTWNEDPAVTWDQRDYDKKCPIYQLDKTSSSSFNYYLNQCYQYEPNSRDSKECKIAAACAEHCHLTSDEVNKIKKWQMRWNDPEKTSKYEWKGIKTTTIPLINDYNDKLSDVNKAYKLTDKDALDNSEHLWEVKCEDRHLNRDHYKYLFYKYTCDERKEYIKKFDDLTSKLKKNYKLLKYDMDYKKFVLEIITQDWILPGVKSVVSMLDRNAQGKPSFLHYYWDFRKRRSVVKHQQQNTVSGKLCVPWQTAKNEGYRSFGINATDNKCGDPSSAGFPWCYTNNTGSWEKCPSSGEIVTSDLKLLQEKLIADGLNEQTAIRTSRNTDLMTLKHSFAFKAFQNFFQNQSWSMSDIDGDLPSSPHNDRNEFDLFLPHLKNMETYSLKNYEVYKELDIHRDILQETGCDKLIMKTILSNIILKSNYSRVTNLTSSKIRDSNYFMDNNEYAKDIIEYIIFNDNLKNILELITDIILAYFLSLMSVHLVLEKMSFNCDITKDMDPYGLYDVEGQRRRGPGSPNSRCRNKGEYFFAKFFELIRPTGGPPGPSQMAKIFLLINLLTLYSLLENNIFTKDDSQAISKFYLDYIVGAKNESHTYIFQNSKDKAMNDFVNGYSDGILFSGMFALFDKGSATMNTFLDKFVKNNREYDTTDVKNIKFDSPWSQILDSLDYGKLLKRILTSKLLFFDFNLDGSSDFYKDKDNIFLLLSNLSIMNEIPSVKEKLISVQKQINKNIETINK